ncbi:MAG: hypothetical protein KC464_20500, partial [Myxococcales bacterium]|nr:hypothetical protein [Myxococcales bacterium]
MGFQGNDLPSMPRGGGGLADLVLGGAETAVAGALLVGFVAAGYALITIDRRRDGSTSRDDGQVGLKLALWGVIVAGVVMAAGGLGDLLAFVLGGFKGGWAGVRGSIATLAAGVGPAAAVWVMFLPRTNGNEKPQVERMALGLIGVIAAVGLFVGLDAFLSSLLAAGEWSEIAGALASLGVNGGLALLAINRLGSMSGWRQPVRPAMPMMPPMGGAPPGGQQMPPLGGGYPPQ